MTPSVPVFIFVYISYVGFDVWNNTFGGFLINIEYGVGNTVYFVFGWNP